MKAPDVKLPASNQASPGSARAFPRESLARTLAELQPRRVLLVCRNPDDIGTLPEQPGARIYTVNPAPGHMTPSVVATLPWLPFQSEVFDLVVVHDLVCDGDERLLGEVRRVLKSGAHLLVIGMGRYGLEHLARRRTNGDGPAAIRPWRLCRRLRQRSFVIEACRGYGIARARIDTGEGWRRPLVTVSDRVCVRARFSQVRPVIRRMRFRQPRAAGAAAGWRRETAS